MKPLRIVILLLAVLLPDADAAQPTFNWYDSGRVFVNSAFLAESTFSELPADAVYRADLFSQTERTGGEITLESGDSRSGNLEVGASHRYRIGSSAGQFLQATVEQAGVDVVLILRAADGERAATMDGLSKTVGAEELSWESAGGDYVLEVQAKSKGANDGRYKITLRKAAAASSRDKARIAAERLFMGARQAQGKGDKASYESAAQKFEAAAEKWGEAGVPMWEGRALSSAGTISTMLARFEAAQRFYERALKLRREAGDTMGEADTLSNVGILQASLGRLAEAGGHFERALSLARGSNDRLGEADILNNLGILYANSNQINKARETFEQVLAIRREFNDRQAEGVLLNNIGLTLHLLQQQSKAIEFFERAIAIGRSVNDRRGVGNALSNLGSAHLALSRYEQALAAYEQALAVRRELGDRMGERADLSNLGIVHMNLSRYGPAREHFEQALAIVRAVGDRKGEGVILTNLGIVYWHLSDYGRALDSQRQALLIARGFKDRRGEAQSLNNTGLVYWGQGELERAQEAFDQAISIRREVGDRLGEASALGNLGNVHMDLGQLDAAQRYYEQAVAVMREVGNRNYEGASISNLGKVYQQQRRFEEALGSFGQALAISREVKDRRSEGLVLSNIGSVHLERGRYEDAAGYYGQALGIARDIKDTSGEAATLYGLSRVEAKRGNLESARAHVEAACDIIESVRTKISGQESRATYFATAQKYYEHRIEVLMRLHERSPSAGFDAAALRVSESKRARSLLEVLNEAGLDVSRGADPELSRRERALRELLNAKAQRRMELLNGPHTPTQAESASKEITELLREHAEIKARLTETSPQHAALTQPRPLSMKEIQQALDADSLLLEYSLGDEASYVWAVTRKSVAGFKLPPREVLDKAARNVFDLLTARNRLPFETDKMREERVAKADAAYPRAVDELSRMVLNPVAARLPGKRLVIVADGALQYLPFAALTLPRGEGGGSRGGRIPLVAAHEILNLPSVSALAVLRGELAGRAPAASGGVAVFADPVFDKEDERLRKGSDGKAAAATPDCSAASDVGQKLRRASLGAPDQRVELPRLPCTRREAAAIAAVAPANALQALDFRASRANVMGGDFKQYRIIHFATHGLLDSANPELSSVVLSLVDEQGNAQNGFLRLHDIYNLNLPVDMVVLSACQSALGKEVKGEGLIGLTRGFMHAGAARLVVSLWEVSDAGAAELMTHFYRGVLKEGLRPSAALRAAQMRMRQEGRWSAPYYWAGFVMQGETR